MQIFRKHSDLTACFFLTLLVLALTIPFLNHAYHIDEPLFLRIAEQIKARPLRPYGFWYLWNSDYEPMSQLAAFSPVFSYYLALIGVGERFPSEWVIHLSLVPFALLAASSLYFLIRQFQYSSKQSFFGAALFVLSPAFALSANLAMPDMAAVSFALLSLVLAMKGWTKDSLRYLVVSGFLLGMASLLRYNTVPLIMVFALLGITMANVKKAVLPSAIALLFLGAITVLGMMKSGKAHTSEVIAVFAGGQGWMSRLWSMNIHLVWSTFLPVIAVLIWWKRGLWWFLLIAFITFDFGLLAFRSIYQFALFPDVLVFGLGISTLLILGQNFLKQAVACQIGEVRNVNVGPWNETTFAIRKLSEYKNNLNLRNAALFLWIISVLFIPLIYVHFASKYLLIAQPAMILLLLYYSMNSKISYKRVGSFLFPVMFVTSFTVAWADFSYADIYRKEAEIIYKKEIAPLLSEQKSPVNLVWFTGHWGWQYYLEKNGAIPLPYEIREGGGPRAGDFLVTARYASANPINPKLKRKLRLTDRHEMTNAIPLLTMNLLGRSGFYSNHWGPLPFNFSRSPAEEFEIFQVIP